jgi:hypothetical protein
MDKFLVLFEIDGIKQWETVLAHNTMHAKDTVRDLYYDNIIFHLVEFLDENDLQFPCSIHPLTNEGF